METGTYRFYYAMYSLVSILGCYGIYIEPEQLKWFLWGWLGDDAIEITAYYFCEDDECNLVQHSLEIVVYMAKWGPAISFFPRVLLRELRGWEKKYGVLITS